MKQLDILENICKHVYGCSLGELPIEKFEHLNEVLCSISWVNHHSSIDGYNYQQIKEKYFSGSNDNYERANAICSKCFNYYDCSTYDVCPKCNGHLVPCVRCGFYFSTTISRFCPNCKYDNFVRP